MEFSFSINLSASCEEALKCLNNIPTLFALNPQWAVKSIDRPDKSGIFTAHVKYDRSEEEGILKCTIVDSSENNSLAIDLLDCNADKSKMRNLYFTVVPQGQGITLTYRETRDNELPLEEKRELILWLRSIGNYIIICGSRNPLGRLWRFFVDRFWLKMSPAGRRMVFIIILFEGLTLLLLLVFVVFKLVISYIQ